MPNRSLIGTIRNTRMPYYDIQTDKVAFKARPVLIIGVENDRGMTDLTVVPVSKISDSRRIIENSDIKLDKSIYPLCNLKEPVSYIRASKLSTVSSKDTSKNEICNLKECYSDFYEEILSAVKFYINGL
ncbi:hypothetical protein CV769_11615 [Enterococcus mundtii]|uniref:type II toxin-antitoxin system PemK/MazF family toxin n=1 Tax=Enterococcus mundtii TaxID=53346 RepID=UPI000C262196|nr:type II toxin-antitoxin system PemK/MazF family toxin [Enterococcus mundtii]PJK25233.1 hypothetical protein CV769_11615 [Enterococcus mundtii]